MTLGWPQKAVALTGSIGTGKTTAAKIFADLGALVLSADEFARKAVEPGSAALESIRKEFGDEVIEDAKLDRKKLGAIVFADASKRKKLEEIVHPEVQRLARAAFESRGGTTAPLVIYDCPLYFESGLDALGFRSSILVAADDSVAIARIMARDGLSEAEATKRLRSQLPIAEKRLRADFILENNGSIDQLKEQARSLWKKLRK